MAKVFEALSDPSRLRILSAVNQTPLCPCLIREVEPMRDSVLSYHLKVLKKAGLVTTSTRSNYRVYRITTLGRNLVSFVRRTSPGPS